MKTLTFKIGNEELKLKSNFTTLKSVNAVVNAHIYFRKLNKKEVKIILPSGKEILATDLTAPKKFYNVVFRTQLLDFADNSEEKRKAVPKVAKALFKMVIDWGKVGTDDTKLLSEMWKSALKKAEEDEKVEKGLLEIEVND